MNRKPTNSFGRISTRVMFQCTVRAVTVVQAEIESPTLGESLVVDGEMSDKLLSPGKLA